jgi:hypothetical protein
MDGRTIGQWIGQTSNNMIIVVDSLNLSILHGVVLEVGCDTYYNLWFATESKISILFYSDEKW